VNGIRVKCVKGLDKMEEGKDYVMVAIGGCYAFYEGNQMVGTIYGRTQFSEYFKFRQKRSKKNRDKRKRRKKKNDNVGDKGGSQ